jgi:Sigma-70, region 4
MLAWLYTIAQRRFAVDARRRRHFDGLATDALEELPAPEGDLDVGGALGDAIGVLPPSQRQIIAMKLLRRSSFRDIASALGVSEPAAKMRFQRALSALRADLEQQGIEPCASVGSRGPHAKCGEEDGSLFASFRIVEIRATSGESAWLDGDQPVETALPNHHLAKSQ